MTDVIEKILELQRPGDVADWFGDARRKPQSLSESLSEMEEAYIDFYTSDEVDRVLRIGRGRATATNLSKEERERARKLFGDGPGHIVSFVNFENRRRIVAHYVLTHPATVAYQLQLYRTTRDAILPLFVAERIYELFTGEEAFTGESVSRGRAVVDIVLIVVIGAALKGAKRYSQSAGSQPPGPRRPLDAPIYDLPPEGGGMRINGRWYTEHALERMAPDTPQIRAELRTRAAARLQRIGIGNSHPAFERCMQRAMQKVQDPRGVPPSVVEAEIMNPGSTNVRVVTARRGQVVVTVIPRKR